jgi:ATP-binding cassette subfamily B protein
MLVYALVFNRRMNAAIRRSHERIGDINARWRTRWRASGGAVLRQRELESQKFRPRKPAFLESRRDDYKIPATSPAA